LNAKVVLGSVNNRGGIRYVRATEMLEREKNFSGDGSTWGAGADDGTLSKQKNKASITHGSLMMVTMLLESVKRERSRKISKSSIHISKNFHSPKLTLYTLFFSKEGSNFP
jgi:hypothetical protein